MNFRRLGIVADLNRKWLAAPRIGVGTKLAYYPHALAALLSRRGSVKYLGGRFAYDHRLTPIILQGYPYEIGNKILANAAAPISTVLDIGANIGQFAVTLARMADVTIDSFEPNPFIFPLLVENISATDRIRAFNYAVCPGGGKRALYFERGRSAIASFYRENSGDAGEPIEIPVTSSVGEITGRSGYDLVKVDVEGGECDVVDALEGLQAKYLFIEITGPAKFAPLPTSTLFSKICERLGPFNVVYQGDMKRSATISDMLLEFVN